MEVKLPAFYEIMTDRLTDRPTDDRRTDRVVGKFHFQQFCVSLKDTPLPIPGLKANFYMVTLTDPPLPRASSPFFLALGPQSTVSLINVY